MPQNFTVANKFYDIINAKSASSILDNNDLLLHDDGRVKICYSPFDHIELSAKIVIVGITPGLAQATNALLALHSAKLAEHPFDVALRKAKMTASFSGPMRANLIEMLDYVGIARHFGIQSSADLFEQGSNQIHFTSALRYPVFLDGKNYSGTPSMLKVPVLKTMVDTHLSEEARLLPNAVWLPLGPKADEALMHLVSTGHLSEHRILSGMPHPSGANAERVAVFTGRKNAADASTKTNAMKLIRQAECLKEQVSNL